MANKIDLKTLRFGTEIEFEGISRQAAAAAICGALPGSRVVPYTDNVQAADGRIWSVVRDGSVPMGGELVTPILTWADMGALQDVVRALRRAGARADETCGNEGVGQHVHVDGTAFKAQPGKLRNLVNLHVRREGMVRQALQIQPQRQRWAKEYDPSLTARIRQAPATLAGMNRAWFGELVRDPADRFGKYHGSRYHALNLYSFFYRGTVEFRHFNGTLHAGEVKANICLALGMVARALSVSHVSEEAVTAPATKTEMTAFLRRCGLLGAEFQNVRVHLSKAFPGRAPEAFLDEVAAPAAAAPAVRMGTMEQLINEEINRYPQPTLAETIAAERRQMAQAGGTDTCDDCRTYNPACPAHTSMAREAAATSNGAAHPADVAAVMDTIGALAYLNA